MDNAELKLFVERLDAIIQLLIKNNDLLGEIRAAIDGLAEKETEGE